MAFFVSSEVVSYTDRSGRKFEDIGIRIFQFLTDLF